MSRSDPQFPSASTSTATTGAKTPIGAVEQPEAQASEHAPGDDSRNETAAGARPAGTVQPREIGGRDGPEPTRFGDWEKGGRCIDF